MILEHLEKIVTTAAMATGAPINAAIIEEARVSFLASIHEPAEVVSSDDMDLLIALGLR